MIEFQDIPKTPRSSLSQELQKLCDRISGKRPRTVIEHILQHGIITTEDLKNTYGYDHPPRAIRDVRENGIPINVYRVKSLNAKRPIAAYTFGDVSNMIPGRLGGRRTFSLGFKRALIERYGSRDTITGHALHPRYLQIDHRVPYEIAGDDANNVTLDDFMLLDASSNRAKSWSCEHCENFLTNMDPELCRSCFWASPEDYSHIAGTPMRRIDLIWSGDEVSAFDRLKKAAEKNGIELPVFIKQRLDK
jgi:hypothetical protein